MVNSDPDFTREIEVQLSFGVLDKGERFTENAENREWVAPHLASGYLQVVGEGAPSAGVVGQG